MTTSYTTTEAKSFTITHAIYLAAKVATDLKRIQRFYGEPDNERIQRYVKEIILLLRNGYLGEIYYGFRRNGNWIVPTLHYTAENLSDGSGTDDDPGRIPIRGDITGATFGSYLCYSPAWDKLSEDEKDEFSRNLPFEREGASLPGMDGYFERDQTYSSGGRALHRGSLRNW